MSYVSQYIAKLASVRKGELRFKIDNVTRAYVTEMGTLVTTGGAFNVKDALALAIWIVEVYGDEDID